MNFKNFKNNAVKLLNRKGVLNSQNDKTKNSGIRFSLNRKRGFFVCAALSVMLLLPSIPFTEITLAYEVKCDGETIGYISSVQVYDEAQKLANNQVVGDIKEVATSPEYNMTIVSNQNVDDVDDLSEKIIDTSDDVIDAYGIYIGKTSVAVSTERTMLNNALNSIKNYYLEKTKADSVSFVNKVKIKKCKSLESEINTEAEIEQAVKTNILVKTEKNVTKTKEIKYKTTYKKDSEYYKGTKTVTREGENGKKKIFKTVSYINGEKTSDKITSEIVTKKAVSEVVSVGTKALPDVRMKSGAKYAWPMKYCSSEYVSSGFGYRNGKLHKGIDICSNYGVEITAAMDGVVVRASTYESYGLCVEIKHADGNTTRYAHCSSLLVSVGDNVIMGETIAKVGSTGRSSGNHCHFEVIENGSYVNPYNYLGK